MKGREAEGGGGRRREAEGGGLGIRVYDSGLRVRGKGLQAQTICACLKRVTSVSQACHKRVTSESQTSKLFEWHVGR